MPPERSCTVIMKPWSIGFTLIALFLCVLLFNPRQPHVQTHVHSTLATIPDKMVTLTFDDGPDPRFTPKILQLLKQHHMTATFFVVGRNALQHPDLVHQIVQAGDVIANHTLTHPHLEQLSSSQVRAEIEGDDAALTSILGKEMPVPHYFRPPRGNVTPAITTQAAALHKELVLWNVTVEHQDATTPEKMAQRVRQLLRDRDGGILLAHDGELDRSLTLQALPLILNDLDRDGYHVVPLATYLQARDAKAQNVQQLKKAKKV